MVLPTRSPRRHERGQALVEYAAIVALIGACLVAILGLMGRSTKRAYEQTSATMTGATGGGYGSGGAGGGVVLVGSSPGRPRVTPETAGTPSDSSGAVGSSDAGGGQPVASR